MNRLRMMILLFGVGSSLHADDRPLAEQLVHVQVGDLPIIISAPHDGIEAVPGVGERTGFAVNQFVTVRDTGAGDVATKLAEALKKAMNGNVHLVVAKFDRRYIDANRPAADAYEWKAAKPIYDHYHNSLAKAKKQVEATWGRGLLVDLHGQAADRRTIFRGTNDGKSCTHMLDRFGKSALTGPRSVLGVLEKKGYLVFPKCDSDEKENPRFGGGYITQTYGSRSGGTIDAIQLEMGWNQRMMKNSGATAVDLADAISVYAKEYLPEKPIKP